MCNSSLFTIDDGIEEIEKLSSETLCHKEQIVEYLKQLKAVQEICEIHDSDILLYECKDCPVKCKNRVPMSVCEARKREFKMGGNKNETTK